MKFNFLKFKKDKKKDYKLKNIEDLLKKIEEDEEEIEKYRKNLTLANERIEKLEQELKTIKNKDGEMVEESGDDLNENKEKIETLILGDNFEEVNLEEEIKESKLSIIDNEQPNIINCNDNINELDEKEVQFNLGKEILEEKLESTNLNYELIDKNECTSYENDIDNIGILDTIYEEDILSKLKEYYLLDNEEKVKNVLEYVIENVKNLEKNFTDNNIVFLIYVSYFYELLEELLKESNKINEYYLNKSKEVVLLNIIKEERNCKIYENINECTQNYMKINRDLFEEFDEELKAKLLENIKQITYKAFSFVYKVNNIEYGVDTYNITALARDNDNSTWKLVEGLVSNNGYEFYLLQTVIKILNLRTIDIAELPNKDKKDAS